MASATTPLGAATPAPELSGKVVFTGMCQAAAASALDRRRVVLADPGDSRLRVYDATRGGAPLAVTDLADWLGWTAPGEPAGIRGGARLAGQSFWLTSHARGRDGRRDPTLSRFFVTTASSESPGVQPIGRPYAQLRKELLKVPGLAALGKGVRKRGPLEAGGLDLAGLADDIDGRSLIIGFRNPVVGGQALALPLLNPADTLEGEAPRFGGLRRIDLQGLGIAGLVRWRDRFLVMAAPVGEDIVQRLFFWDGASPTAEPVSLGLEGLAPSAAVAVGGRVLLLGGGGANRAPACEASENREKRLPAVWVSFQ
jgi:hypothetical protein